MADLYTLNDVRELLPFPKGNNATDTIFGGNHFNVTTLRHFNYTYYDQNYTISNGSKCWLTFSPYQPALQFPNGSFVNATKCYSAILPIGSRAYTGIGFACAFGLALIFVLTLLAKHGKIYLPVEKRFVPIGRRWQWYWGCFICATALISLFVNVDVDRYYLQEMPITVTVFFWFLMCQGTLALTWEAVRHWGSWQERQFIDPNPFVYGQDDRRSKFEFWLPLWFYFWVWMNFFLVVPRSWKFAELQRSVEQTAQKAIPAATSGRFKAAGFCLVIAWLTILVSLRHSINFYKPRNRGIFNRVTGFVRAVPFRFMLILPLSGALIAYQIYISFVWKYSIIKYDGVVAVIYCWGYGPALLILFVQAAYGFASPNEDKELLRQRRLRGEHIDRELGIVKKPAWWRRVRGDHMQSMRDKIAKNVQEVGGGRATGRRVEEAMERQIREDAERAAMEEAGYDIELQAMGRREPANPSIISQRSQPYVQPYSGKSETRRHERNVQAAASLLFPNDLAAERARREADLAMDGPPAYSDEVDRRRGTASTRSDGRTNSVDTTNSINQPPQQIRSMLDL
ncbi:hypothetical protein G7046_g4990 [Stylonectria norvegica]|nr:hypothetical protein G7046_g4990 [Stylonectria norvegica]